MATTQDDNRVVAVFKTHTRKDEVASREAGRPVYTDLEVCEVRFAGNRQTVGVYPAHSFCQYVTTPDGYQEEQTYAMRWNEQYRRFKENRQQVKDGTPLEELPFIPQAKRMELKALNIHTAEALAAVDGNELKTLGMGGRELKSQAQGYIDAAQGSAVVTKQAAEIEALKERIAAMERHPLDHDGDGRKGGSKPKSVAPEEPAKPSEFDAFTDAEIKTWIKDATGEAPRGNPSRETLIRMADEIYAEQSKA